jgi:hypothetical protein
LPYLLSFTVLGLRWLASIEFRSRAEYYKRAYVNSWLFFLLLVRSVSIQPGRIAFAWMLSAAQAQAQARG